MASTITLADAQGSPVNHDFVPTRKWTDPSDRTNYWEFLDTSVNGGAPALANRILIGSKVTSRGTGKASDWAKTITVACFTPVGETLSNNDQGLLAQPQKAYEMPFFGKIIRPGRASLQTAKDLRKYAQFLLAEAQVLAMIETLTDPT